MNFKIVFPCFNSTDFSRVICASLRKTVTSFTSVSIFLSVKSWEYILPIIKKLEKNNSAAVCGSRMINKKNALKGKMPIYKFIGNIFLTKLFNIVYSTNYTDCHTGYWIYNLKYLNKSKLFNLTNTFNFDNQMRINLTKNKLEIKEIPIKTIYGNERSSVHLIYALKFFFETILKKFT